MPSQAPPAYDTSSVTDEISDLITKALHIQDLLNKAKLPLSRVDEAVGSTFSVTLSGIDDVFVNLVAESRTSAATLASTIDYFVNAVVPMSKDKTIPLIRRYETVQDSAEQISQSANEHYPSIKNNVDEVKKSIDMLHQQMSELREKQLASSLSELGRLNAEIYSLALTIKGHPKGYAKLSKESKVIVDGIKKPVSGGGQAPTMPFVDHLPLVKELRFLIEFFTRDVEAEKNRPIVDAKVAELGVLRGKLESKKTQLEEASSKISELIILIDGVQLDIGNFGAIWNKLVSDSKELKAYLDSAGIELDEMAFVERVEGELPLYTNIRGTLEDYCLRV